jgi:hypothetical protein
MIQKYKSKLKLKESEGLFIYPFIKFKGEWIKEQLLKTFKNTQVTIQNIKIEITGTVEVNFTLPSGALINMDVSLKLDDNKGKVAVSFVAYSDQWSSPKEVSTDFAQSMLDYRAFRIFILENLGLVKKPETEQQG